MPFSCALLLHPHMSASIVQVRIGSNQITQGTLRRCSCAWPGFGGGRRSGEYAVHDDHSHCAISRARPAREMRLAEPVPSPFLRANRADSSVLANELRTWAPESGRAERLSGARSWSSITVGKPARSGYRAAAAACTEVKRTDGLDGQSLLHGIGTSKPLTALCPCGRARAAVGRGWGFQGLCCTAKRVPFEKTSM